MEAALAVLIPEELNAAGEELIEHLLFHWQEASEKPLDQEVEDTRKTAMPMVRGMGMLGIGAWVEKLDHHLNLGLGDSERDTEEQVAQLKENAEKIAAHMKEVVVYLEKLHSEDAYDAILGRLIDTLKDINTMYVPIAVMLGKKKE